MSDLRNDPLMQMETTCGSFLYELKVIWDEVGESDEDRDKMLLELERECLDVYGRKVDRANRHRAQLRRAIADSEAELASICSAMGERPVHVRQLDKKATTLKADLGAVLPQLEEMRKRKSERRNHFADVMNEIQKISHELCCSTDRTSSSPPHAKIITVDESDLSLRRLDEHQKQLHALQAEKSDRLKRVAELLHSLNSLCAVLGMDSKQLVMDVDPSFGDCEAVKNISSDTIERLAGEINRLHEVKLQRMQRLQDLAASMLELWSLMDTPVEEQQMFESVTCNVAASEQEITKPDTLSLRSIACVDEEVTRLEALKGSKMKELVMKKKSELEEICRKSHMVVEMDSTVEYAVEAIESGAVDPSSVLEQIELQVAELKEDAFSRKDILDKLEKWLCSCQEETWLEEYNRDENRYNAGRGSHLNLKRAEKARSLVNKIPGLVEVLACKVKTWEKERGNPFTYDGIGVLSMLENYSVVRQEKEEERRRQRDQKKLQGQIMTEQEALFGSKPSPSKSQLNSRKNRFSTGVPVNNNGGGRRLSLAVTPARRRALADDVLSLDSRTPFSPLSSDSSPTSTNVPPPHHAVKKNLNAPVVDDCHENVPPPPRTPPPTVTVFTPNPLPHPDLIEYSFEERRAAFLLSKVL